jgi:peroxiredoxin
METAMSLLKALRRTAFLLCGIGALALPVHAAEPTGNAPDFTLKSAVGSNLRLQEQRGRVVMINFWATWCGPCRVEMPHLNRLYDKYRSAGFQLLGVNIDEDPAKAQALASKLGLQFPVLFDADKRVSKLYDLTTMPSTVLVDRDGRVRHVHRGYRDGLETTYEQQIRALLKE